MLSGGFLSVEVRIKMSVHYARMNKPFKMSGMTGHLRYLNQVTGSLKKNMSFTVVMSHVMI
jgi:hypothetical protein